ncbi:MAG: hypothetical protein KDC12_15555 [Flavobacteriales bacterium]|nr:hypothetical protein [Flavobacteriales bacterium]
MNWKRIVVGVMTVGTLAAIVISCSTKVELNAPYRPVTLLFGLLDSKQDTQFIKINKTWLGDGDNLVYASLADSSEYPEGAFNGIVTRYVDGNPTSDEYLLQEIILDNKSTDGIFWSPTYKAYYFVSPGGLDTESTYEIVLDFADKDDVYAETDMITPQTNDGNITQPPAGFTDYKFNLVNVGSFGITYNDFPFQWTALPNSQRYEINLIFHYVEYRYTDIDHTNLESTTHKTVNWFIGTEVASEAFESMEREVNWLQLFQVLSQRIEPDPYVIRQVGTFDGLEHDVFDFVLTIGNEELSTYMDVNEPVTGIIQERPEYTNVANGLGLFASRLQQTIPGIGITSNSLTELIEGDITGSLGFCSPIPNSPESCDP